jgi:hypothetical protein
MSPLSKPYLVLGTESCRTNRSIRNAEGYLPEQSKAKCQLHKGCFSAKSFTKPVTEFAFMVAISDRINHY